MRRIVLFLAAVLLVSVAVPAAADTDAFQEYPLSPGWKPVSVATGFDAVWYTVNDPVNKVVKRDLRTGGVLAEYDSPMPGLHAALATGLGKVWFAPEMDVGAGPPEVMFSLDPDSGAIAAYPLPTDAAPARLAVGFGAVWYTSLPNNSVGRLNPGTGDVVEYPLSTNDAKPVGIATDNEYVWFGQLETGMIGRLDPSDGSIIEYPTGEDLCCSVATGFGDVWFTMFRAGSIGRFDPVTQSIETYQTPTEDSFPMGIVTGDSFMWFTEWTGNNVGRLDPHTGISTEFEVPTAESHPFGLAYAGSDVWFAENNKGASRIGRLHVDRFLDDGDSVFEHDIEWIASKGITKGCNPKEGNTKYCPDSYVTRGQMSAFLDRALNFPSTSTDFFIDDNGTTFEASINRMAAAGVTKGCNPKDGNDRFCPDKYVTRAQMASFLVRAMGYTDNGGGNLFIDDDGSIHEKDIDKLGTAGVTYGCNPKEGNTKYCPDSYVTRGQMAAFLHRALKDILGP